MPIDRGQARPLLKAFDFRRLFVEHLGWDKNSRTVEKVIDGQAYRFQSVAEKHGVAFLVCNSIPDSTTRLKLDKLIAKDHFQHLIVFADLSAGKQLWQWVRREAGKPLSVRTQQLHGEQSGELLLQKLDHLVVGLEEEDEIAHAHITGRVQAGFDIEKVTKKFYERFKTEHDEFLSFVEGLPDEGIKAWYASVMINRLMFLYFLQAKGFLDGDNDYLRNKLKESRDRKKDAYYRDFLSPLFFQGFACKKEDRSANVNKLLGNIPYLNGGLFQRHQIETLHDKKIEVADAAFQRLFDFFKEYNWHLDERETREGNEINPDVLGYIFEKYINQKQMGAYYTKEDITEYISQNTIIPFLLDAARKDCAVAFDSGGSVWRLLRDNPERYIHDALRHGMKHSLPTEIAAGLNDVSKRMGWNRAAPPEFALPTEIWREVVERRRRFSEVRAKLSAGEVHEVNDLITLNLNIRQFAQDVIQYCEGSELLWALYKAISRVSILDPTCGSGAFLFAALNILKPLYEACLQRMQMFVDELDASPAQHPKKFGNFREALQESRQHPKQDYFVLKSIIVGNLYGVDIMEEAVEICKLRLFLKLVAQLEPGDTIEPLPDVDFNIRAGNTLVGYARLSDIKSGQGNLYLEEQKREIEDEALRIDAPLRIFRKQQTRLNGTVTVDDKIELRKLLSKLDSKLNDFLAAEYGVKKSGVKTWIHSNKPFHWFNDFHRIMEEGGFDVIIGNPPYVVFPSEKVPYKFLSNGFSTISTKNLYALTWERSLALLAGRGYASLIVQLTVMSSERMSVLQNLLVKRGTVSILSFPRRPESMFDGVEMPVAIVSILPKKTTTFATTRINRFYTQEREHALRTLQLLAHDVHIHGHRIGKLGNALQRDIFKKLSGNDAHCLGEFLQEQNGTIVYYQEACRYWAKACLGLPRFRKNGKLMEPSHGRVLRFNSPAHAGLGVCLLNSSIFWWAYSTFCDCEHINDDFVRQFPVPPKWQETLWSERAKHLGKAIGLTSTRKTIRTRQGHTIEYDEIRASNAKTTIDGIDRLLAGHYGLTDEELDFIINYDIKYRLGADVANED